MSQEAASRGGVDDPSDPFARGGYGQNPIEPGERPAVLVVDFQYAFTDSEFAGADTGMIDRAVVNTARLLEVAREVRVPVFQSVMQWEGELDIGLWPIKIPYTARIKPGSRWAQVDKRVWHASDVILPKRWPSFFNGTALQSLLTAANRDTVVVAGCATSGCVRATVVDAFSAGLRTLVPEDCVGDVGLDAHSANLRDVQRRYAEVITSDEAIAYLRGIPNPRRRETDDA